MFKKVLNLLFKLQEIKNFKFKLSDGSLYKLQVILKPFKEKPKLFGFALAQLFLWVLIITNIIFFKLHTTSHTQAAITNGQMALVNLESDAVIVGQVIADSKKKEELAKQFEEVKEKNLENDKTTTQQEEKVLFRAPPLPEEDTSKKKIVIIVTDLGLSKSMTLEALQLSQKFTLGFSPYANNVDEWIDQASSKGFEALVNLPMQPIDYPVNDPGPYAMLQNLSIGENLSRLDWVLARSKKIAGVYSSQNEAFTSSRANILPVLENLKKHRKIFAYGNFNNDQSLTSLSSSIGVEYAAVNFCIDEELTEQKINSNLLRLEGLAMSQGYAIGYMNPYPISIKSVNAWLEGIDKKAIAIVPLSNLFEPLKEEEIIAEKNLEEQKLREENAKYLESNKGAATQPAKENHAEAEGEHSSSSTEH